MSLHRYHDVRVLIILCIFHFPYDLANHIRLYEYTNYSVVLMSNSLHGCDDPFLCVFNFCRFYSSLITLFSSVRLVLNVNHKLYCATLYVGSRRHASTVCAINVLIFDLVVLFNFNNNGFIGCA